MCAYIIPHNMRRLLVNSSEARLEEDGRTGEMGGKDGLLSSPPPDKILSARGGDHSPSHIAINPRCLSYEYGGKYAKYAVVLVVVPEEEEEEEEERPPPSSSSSSPPPPPRPRPRNRWTCVQVNRPSSYDVSDVLVHERASKGVDPDDANVEYPRKASA